MTTSELIEHFELVSKSKVIDAGVLFPEEAALILDGLYLLRRSEHRIAGERSRIEWTYEEMVGERHAN